MRQDESSVVEWSEDGSPRSRLYGDVYFSKQDGLAESRAVFLAGCGLPEAWRERDQFCVGELGFGTGLNILALLDLWRRQGRPAGRLNIFSIEAHPLPRDEAAQALAPWPELAEVADLLLARWPGRARGMHRVDLPELSATLDLAVMDAAAALQGWRGSADAWFLDGFAPAANPAMWSEAVLDLVGKRSRPGARAATFTVAGGVRRGLAAAGFEVEKRPGFGRKRERLEARLPQQPPVPSVRGAVAIIGAGIAGASLARAFRALGRDVTVIDQEGPGAGASGNAAALVSPRLDAGLGGPAQLHAQAYARAQSLYQGLAACLIETGALVLEATERDRGRFTKIAAGDLFEPGQIEPADAAETSRRLGEAAAPGLILAGALTIMPGPILEAWCGEVLLAQVERLQPVKDGWRLMNADGGLVMQAELVCVAGGAASRRLIDGLHLQPVRGQASQASGVTPPVAVSFGGYAIFAPGGMLFGATFDRDDEDTSVRLSDQAQNLRQLADSLPGLALSLAGAHITSRASIRAATPDRMPLAGAAAPGLFILSGLGSHGFCLAPLLAEDIAARACDAPSPLPADLARLVDPSRYLTKSLSCKKC